MTLTVGLRQLLGEPRNVDSPSELPEIWTEVESEFQVEAPADVKEFLEAYGSVRIWGYLFIFAPSALVDAQKHFGPSISRRSIIPEPLLPEAGGMLLWGSTVDADQLFLVQRPGGWRVAAWLRQWAEWYESDLPLAEWMEAALSPELPVEWLPEWEYPLKIEVLRPTTDDATTP
jgi:hypothetical protein